MTSCKEDDQPCYFVEETCLSGLVAKSGSSPCITHFRFHDMQDSTSLSSPLYNMINNISGDKQCEVKWHHCLFSSNDRIQEVAIGHYRKLALNDFHMYARESFRCQIQKLLGLTLCIGSIKSNIERGIIAHERTFHSFNIKAPK